MDRIAMANYKLQFTVDKRCSFLIYFYKYLLSFFFFLFIFFCYFFISCSFQSVLYDCYCTNAL